MFHWLAIHNPTLLNWGLLFIRIGIGAIIMKHGYDKMLMGMPTWTWLGSQMSNFGIRFAPAFWGFLAVCSEFFGGILLMVGLFTRLGALLTFCVMIVALSFHFSKGDPFKEYELALVLGIIFFGLLLMGPGKYSLDSYLFL